jgi:hypothetical protein
LASFTERVIGAAKLDVKIYEEVEADISATGQAMGVVLLTNLALVVGLQGIVFDLKTLGITGVILGGVAAVLSWALNAFLTYFIGTRLFPEPQTSADPGELMRTLGFSYAPGLGLIFVQLGGIDFLSLLLLTIVAFWLVAAMVIAVRQALDYTSTPRAVGVCLLGQVSGEVISFIFLGLLGVIFI